MTLRDVIDHLEGRQFARPPAIEKLFAGHDAGYGPRALGPGPDGRPDLSGIKGLVWRQAGAVRVNPDRPFIADLDDLPMPMHHLLPLQKYRMPLVKGAYLVHRHEPRLPGRLQVLHQARELRPDHPPALRRPS